MKAVLDTNIFISGVFFGGIPGKILDAWADNKYEIYITPNIFEEYIQTMNSYGGKRAESLINHWITTIAEHAHHLLDPIVYPSFCRDPQDDKFLYCALSAKADYLVTGDKDLTSLEGKTQCNIVSPRAFWNILLEK